MKTPRIGLKSSSFENQSATATSKIEEQENIEENDEGAYSRAVN